MTEQEQLSQICTDVSRLRITEIFYSIQGESLTVGVPTVFIRLTGCPLRCHYCDTAYAFSGGTWWSFEEIFREISRYACQYVTVTGGEPLAQKACRDLLAQLVRAGFRVSLETSGAISVDGIDPGVAIVMDLKTPGSGEHTRNVYENISLLKTTDQIKLVLCDRNDYLWAKQILQQYDLIRRCTVLMSPCYQRVQIKELAEWILQDQLAVRLQLQLHKIIWGDVPGH